jgi:hypothetical protein
MFGMKDGVRGQRPLQEHCRYDARYRFLTGGHVPDDRTFGRFLLRVGPFLDGIFAQVVAEAKTKGLAKVNEVAIDGTKVSGSASWWKGRAGSEEASSDPDARMMVSHGRGVFGYNMQVAVDTESGLIVGIDVVNEENDYHQAPNILERVVEATGEIPAAAVSDTGFVSPEAIGAVGDMGIDTVFCPKEGLPESLVLNEMREVVCPAGKPVVAASLTSNNGRPVQHHRPEGGCRGCPLGDSCAFKGKTTQIPPETDLAAKYLNKERYESEAYAGAMMRRRKVERPFAQMKCHDRFDRFHRRGLPKVRAEALLWGISFNIRMIFRAFSRLFAFFTLVSTRNTVGFFRAAVRRPFFAARWYYVASRSPENAFP